MTLESMIAEVVKRGGSIHIHPNRVLLDDYYTLSVSCGRVTIQTLVSDKEIEVEDSLGSLIVNRLLQAFSKVPNE